MQTVIKCNTTPLLAPEGIPHIKTPITVRIEAGLLAEMRQLAREENRTLTNFIETVLRQRFAGAVASSSPTSEAPPAHSVKQIKDKPTHAA